MTPAVTRAEKRLYEFDGFRVDPVRRRLVKDNELVPITPKAFSILLILIESRGGVVEKEDIIQKVWPDTFVTEANLTQNVSSLRKALGERANDARYIVTVPGRGYSFVADVFEVPRDATGEISLAMLPPMDELIAMSPEPKPDWALPGRSAPVAPSVPASLPPEASVPPVPVPQVSLAPRGPKVDPLDTVQIVPSPGTDHDDTGVIVVEPIRKQVWLWAVGAVVLLILITLGVTRLGKNPAPSSEAPAAAAGSEEAPPPAARSSVAVLTIRNTSGKASLNWLGSILAELVTTDLSTSSRLRVISGEHVIRARQSRLMQNPESLNAEQLRQLHELVRADFAVFGTVGEKNGDGKLQLELRVLRLPEGGIAGQSSEEGTQTDLFDLVSRASAKLRKNMGWGTPSAEETKASLSLRIASPDAARLYVEGLERLRRFDALGASERLTRAAEADPGSPLIQSALSQAWMDLGYSARAAAAAEEASRLSDSLPKTERLTVGARYHEANSQWDHASRAYRALWKLYPDDLEYGLRLVRSLTEAGHGAEARQALAVLRKLPPPDNQDPRIDLAEALVAKRMSDYSGAFRASVIATEKSRQLQERQVLAQALTLQGDALVFASRPQQAWLPYEEAEQLFRESGNRGGLAMILTHRGVALHEQGDLAGARPFYDQALQIAEEIGNEPLKASQLANLGLLQQDLGHLPEARQLLDQALALYRKAGDRVLEGRTLNFLGTVLVSMGDVAGARQRFEQAVAVSRTTGNRTDEARSLDNLGSTLARQGSLAAARRYHEEALAIAKRLSDPNRAAGIKASLAGTLARQGKLDQAHRMLVEALADKNRAGDRIGASQVLGQLSEIALHRGDLQAARQTANQQLDIAERAGARLLAANASRNLARCDLAEGRLAQARSLFETALRTSTSLGEETDSLGIRLDLARVALAEGRPTDAANQARQVAELCGRGGLPGCQAQSLAVLSRSLSAQGLESEAQRTATLARNQATRTEDRWIQGFVRASTAPPASPANAGAESGAEGGPGRSAR
ncbi:MAG TPA: tetratricopeptide repeat protein [Thermoanaerobaculia bacterium]|nr:tetratricopeptide repeat protein [Thermoanaerobaculia bacterium]